MNEAVLQSGAGHAGEYGDAQPSDRAKRALIQAVVLTALMICAFRGEAASILAQATTMVQAAHVLAVPVLVALLVYCRREVLVRDLRGGSAWGVVLIALAIGIYATATWPFYVAYVRKLQFATAAAGIVLATGGWRWLWRCGPMVLLMAVAIPVGWNTYSTMIIRPETLTMDVAARLLDALPGWGVTLHGTDLHCVHAGVTSVAGLGDPHVGCMAPVSLACLYLFVVFARVRPWWQVAIFAVVGGPLVLLGNLLRVLAHAWLTVSATAAPLDRMPRDAALVISLLAVYGMAVVIGFLLDRLLVDGDEATDEADQGLPAEDCP